jgi:hypothetical protein
MLPTQTHSHARNGRSCGFARLALRPTWPLAAILSLLLAVPASFANIRPVRTLAPVPLMPTEENSSPTQLPEEEQSQTHVAPVFRATFHDSRLHCATTAILARHLAAPTTPGACVLRLRSERLGHNGCGGPLRC